ncbi:MAG: hypothetical protein Q9204_004584 [Flavoplaca sp. TL-2023a]
MAKLDEIRALALEKRLAMGEDLANHTATDKREYQVGDLVRLRRLAQDNQKSHKLEPRWEGPYTVAKISNHKRSGYLDDPHSGNRKGKFHVNDVALLYRQRKPTGDIQEETWMSVAAINDKVRADVRRWMKEMAEDQGKNAASMGPQLQNQQQPHNHMSIQDEEDSREYWQYKACDLRELIS